MTGIYGYKTSLALGLDNEKLYGQSSSGDCGHLYNSDNEDKVVVNVVDDSNLSSGSSVINL